MRFVITCCALSLFLACGSDPDKTPDAPKNNEDAAIDASTRDGGTQLMDASSEKDAASHDAASDRDAASDEDAGEGPTPPAVAPLCIGCANDEKLCAGKCAATDDPWLGCGDSSCNACSLSHALPGCDSDGACKIASCEQGWSDCDGNAANGCETDLTNPDTCAGCGEENNCSFDELCSPMGCVAACAPPLTECGSRCVDLTTSASHCGGCEMQCSLPDGEERREFPSCAAGACGVQCFGDFKFYGDRCWDTTRTKEHCGTSDRRCKDSEECVDSTCAPRHCQSGWTNCDGTCVTLQTDANHCGACGVTCGGAEVCVAGDCVAATSRALAKGQSEPADLVLDATHVYWTNRGDNTVKAIAKSGGTIRTLGTNQPRPRHPVVDDSHVYWSNQLGGAIMRAPKDGSAAPTLVTTAVEPRVIAVAGQYLYLPGDGEILRVNKTGGTPTHFATIEQTESPASFHAFVVDGDALYVAASHGSSSMIWHVDLSDGDVDEVKSIERSLTPALVVDANNIYYGHYYDVSAFLGINWVDKTSGMDVGGVGTRADGNEVRFVTQLAVASCGVLWTEGQNLYLSRPGYELAATLASGKIAGIATDNSAVYWTDANGIIGKLAKP